jgi:hypothetical protein
MGNKVINQRWNTRLMHLVILASLTLVGLFAFTPSASAATTLPTKMNFQGRLTNSSGNIVSNGTYNMRFRIWNASSGGVQQWSEDRLVSASQGVTVTNGQFSVQLGSITSLPASVFTSNSLYFEVELPTPATATGSSPSWTEGAMTPRNQLATSAYAYNAEMLDGIDGSAFAQMATGNTFTAAQTINVSSTAAFDIQNGSSVSVFKVDSSTSTITIGSATNGAVFSSTGVQFNGTARATRTISLIPEYQGATFTADGSNNTGSLSSDFCSSSALLSVPASNNPCTSAADEYNFYAWTTSQGTAQDYDIYVRYQIPSDYDTGSMTNLRFTAQGTNGTNEAAVLAMFKGSSTACTTLSDAITSNATWATTTSASPLGACSITAGDMVTFRVKLTATSNGIARAGTIDFTYRSKF